MELLLTFHVTFCNKRVCPRPQGHLLGPEPPTATVQLGTTRALHCESSQNVSQFTWTFIGMPVRVQGDPDETPCKKRVCPYPQGHLLGPEPPTATVQLGTTRALHCESSQNVSQFTWTFIGMPVRVQGDPDETPCKKRVCPYPQGHLSGELTFVACDECEV